MENWLEVESVNSRHGLASRTIFYVIFVPLEPTFDPVRIESSVLAEERGKARRQKIFRMGTRLGERHLFAS